MSKLSEEEAVALLKETFKEHEAEAESLPLARTSRTPRRAAAALLAAASVAAVVAGGLYAANRGGGEQVAVTPPASTPSAGQIPPTSQGQQAPSVYGQAYAEVIKTLLTNVPKPGKLVILNASYLGIFPGDKGYQRGTPFSESTQADIGDRIRPLGPVSWVEDKPVQKDICNPQPQGIVVITLGEVVRKGGHLEIAANSWQSCLAAEWLTYRLDQGATGWKISGTVGPHVIA